MSNTSVPASGPAFGRWAALYTLGIRAFFHRLRFDLARELVVGICALVLLSLFVYIFNDFINIKLKSLSTGMSQVFARVMGSLVLSTATLIFAAQLRADRRSGSSIGSMASRLGEHPRTILLFRTMKLLTIFIIVEGAALFVTIRWFGLPGFPWLAILLGFWLVILLLAWRISGSPLEEGSPGQERRPRLTLRPVAAGPTGRPGTILRWRVGQMSLGRTTRICLMLVPAFSLPVFLAAWSGTHFLAGFLAALVSGLFAAAAMATQLGQDMRYAWAERSMGVSHQDIITAWNRTGLGLAALTGALLLTAWMMGSLLAGSSLPPVTDLVALVAAGAVSPLVMPPLMFQIDPNRAALQMITCTLVSLFLATAIFAHWASLLLVPLLHYYGHQYQTNRFYRA